jgi:asparagine synthase (glutamine-hydrolysing)
MCGIFGAISLSDNFDSKNGELFTEILNKISYRGPDGFGNVYFNSRTGISDEASYNIFLGHRRLSIIDLSSAGYQPMKKGEYYITFNGEIYNYIELRAELIQKGYHFETETDTEVLIKIYQEYGSSGFAKLNGMWSFAIFDIVKNKIILSRDRFSEKPLFYYHQGDKFYFASEIKQLLPLMNSKLINEDILEVYLKQGILDYSDRTFFKGIMRLESKQNLIIDLNAKTFTKEKYWDYEYEEIDDTDVFERFRDLLNDSVKIRLRSDVPVGCMLSGGLDSSSISLIAHDFIGNRLDTFSVISDDIKLSEEPFINEMVNVFNLRNTKLNFESNHILKNFDKVLYHHDEPFFNFSVLAGYAMLEKIKSNTNVTVLLNGQGGDELLMGYLKYFFFYEKQLIKEGKFIKATSLLLSAIFNRTIINQFNFGYAKRYLPFLNSKSHSYFANVTAPFDMSSFNNIRDRQIEDIDRFSIPSICRYEDRNSMAHSLEMRTPFLDYRLVNFSLNLRNDLKIKKGWTKFVLRKAMFEMPEKIRYRKDKNGFQIPEEKYIRHDLREEILSISKNSLLHDIGIIDKNKFGLTYKNLLAKKSLLNNFSDISRVYIAERWMRKNFK